MPPRCERCSGSKPPVGLSTHRGDNDLVRVPVPRSLYAYDDAPTPLAARNELRTLKASIPAQSDDIARFKLEDAHGAACLHVREHPLWGAKTHGLSHVRSIKEIFRTKRYSRCSTSIALLSQLTAQMRRYRHVAPIAPRQSDRPRPARTQPAGALDRTQGYSGEPVNHQTSDGFGLSALLTRLAPDPSLRWGR